MDILQLQKRLKRVTRVYWLPDDIMKTRVRGEQSSTVKVCEGGLVRGVAGVTIFLQSATGVTSAGAGEYRSRGATALPGPTH